MSKGAYIGVNTAISEELLQCPKCYGTDITIKGTTYTCVSCLYVGGEDEFTRLVTQQKDVARKVKNIYIGVSESQTVLMCPICGGMDITDRGSMLYCNDCGHGGDDFSETTINRGVAKKVKNAYIGVNGVARQVYSSAPPIPMINFLVTDMTNNETYANKAPEGTPFDDWLMSEYNDSSIPKDIARINYVIDINGNGLSLSDVIQDGDDLYVSYS